MQYQVVLDYPITFRIVPLLQHILKERYEGTYFLTSVFQVVNCILTEIDPPGHSRHRW